MKAILMSVHAKWCTKIMNKDKTIEVRKGTALYKAIQKLIDKYGYADIYVYCTKDKKECLYIPQDNFFTAIGEDLRPYIRTGKPEDIEIDDCFNGYVVFKFRCYKVEEIRTYDRNSDFFEKSCLSQYELNEYLTEDIGCAIHISDLEIFDKPKELSEFEHEVAIRDNVRGYIYEFKKLTKAPQSFCYIEVGE